MNFIDSTSTLVFSIALASSAAMATEPPQTPTTQIGCSKHADSALISFSAEAWTSMDNKTYQSTCPLLENKALRKFVDKFAVGTVFAHPAIPYTCLSGEIEEGTIEIYEETVDIDAMNSYSESAQRLSPVPLAQGGISLFATSGDGTLKTGAAMTAVHLEAGDYTFDLLVDDHFLLTDSGEDTEDFSIVGSKGDYKVSGRLTGRGQIISQEPLGIQFTVTGNICLE